MQHRAYRYRPDGYVTAIDDHLAGNRALDLTRSTPVPSSAEPATRYEHDAQGRVILRQQKRLSAKPYTWRYTWDADDRLVAVSDTGRPKLALPV